MKRYTDEKDIFASFYTKGVYIIKPQEHTRWRVMRYQAFGLDKKIDRS